MDKVRNELTGKMMFYPWHDIDQADFEVEIDDTAYYVRVEYLKEYSKRVLKLRTYIGGASLAVVVLISALISKEYFWVKMLGIIALDIVVVLFLYYIVISRRVLPKDLMEIMKKKKV